MKADITYAPELIGEDTRLIAEREFLKLQVVLSQLADTITRLQNRIEELEASNAASS